MRVPAVFRAVGLTVALVLFAASFSLPAAAGWWVRVQPPGPDVISAACQSGHMPDGGTVIVNALPVGDIFLNARWNR